MKQKSELEVAVAAALKSVRTAVRLKHSLAADRELNEVLPGIEAAINAAFAEGKPYKPAISAIFED